MKLIFAIRHLFESKLYVLIQTFAPHVKEMIGGMILFREIGIILLFWFDYHYTRIIQQK